MNADKRRYGIAALLLIAVFAGGVLVGQQKRAFGQPKTIIHFVYIKWRVGTTEVEQKKAMDGILAMAGKIPGIRNVWIKTIRAQQPFNTVFAIEFANQDAADDYRDHPAHKAWENEYLTIRETSLSGQATN